MTEAITIDQLVQAIERLPSDPPRRVPGVWYETQKQHWLGWLSEYEGPGAYGRIPARRNAKWVYNHVVNPYMLFWLVEASGVRAELVTAARTASSGGGVYSARSGAIRRVVPWAVAANALWRMTAAPNGA